MICTTVPTQQVHVCILNWIAPACMIDDYTVTWANPLVLYMPAYTLPTLSALAKLMPTSKGEWIG
jgi:hypothetical protein